MNGARCAPSYDTDAPSAPAKAPKSAKGAVAGGLHLGFFEDEGIDLEIVEFEGTGTLLPQMVNKRVLIGYPNPDPLIISQMPDRDTLPLQFFYNVTRSSAWEVVVLEDSPVQSLTDLEGELVGVGALTWGNIPITRAMFADVGLTVGESVELQPVGTGAPAFRALSTGQVAALNLFDVQHALLEASGTSIRRIPLEARFADLFSNGFIAHVDTVRDQAPLLEAFGRAVARGTVACEAAPENCVLSFWESYPAQRPTEGDADENLARGVTVMRSRFDKFLTFPEGQPRRFGEYPVEGWSNFVDALYEGGQITTRDIDVSPLFTNALVDGFNDFDVEAAREAGRTFR
ncbi:MAG: hypothetical protein EA356_03110 [Geminicoccaceae bacterium]|nr:MAG: hypothetical protein EA356_03110 [Geminicoccaceae bacterium]